MRSRFFATSLIAVGLVAAAGSVFSFSTPDERIRDSITRNHEYFREVYRHFHQYPELSEKEELTSQRLAAELRKLGFETTERVGGFGVVGVLRNGQGPTIMVRTDMDALPITEETGLPYASKNPGVMHACGHDMHMATFLGTAAALAGMKDQWKGTLVFVGQPAEEVVRGANAMIDDGLFTRFPKPDYALALHITGVMPAGQIGYRAGQAMAAVDSLTATLRGIDAHGAQPHRSVDPIVLGSEYVLKMNSLVAREVDPLVPALITVGSFHGGTKHNIIPASVELKLTIRNLDENVRTFLKQRVVDVAKELARASRAPEPKLEFVESVASQYNDPALTARLVPALRASSASVIDRPATMGGEDFAEFTNRGGFPGLLFWLGVTNPGVAQPWPANHTSRLAPDFDTAWPVGVGAMTRAVLLLQADAPGPFPMVKPAPVTVKNTVLPWM